MKVNWIWGVAILLMAGRILAAAELRWLLAGVLALGCILAVLIRITRKRAI